MTLQLFAPKLRWYQKRFPYLTGSHDSRSKPLWMDCAIEDSIRSTYLTTSGANRSCRCLWNFPLHKLSRTEKQNLGKNPQLLCQHTTYTQRRLSSTLNIWLLRECPRTHPPKKKEKEKSTWIASKFMLKSAWKGNGIQKHFTHLCLSSKKKKQSFPLKSNKTTTEIFLGAPCTRSPSSSCVTGRRDYSTPSSSLPGDEGPLCGYVLSEILRDAQGVT